ncbi:MAG TPA: hypothetical protein EYQ60_11940 [Myxococcales bacterium]|nr:hypothetical protein [Myxococcales bacterium]
MPSIIPRIHPLPNGGDLVIREATREDAAALLPHVEAVSGESPFLTFGPGEFELTVDQEADFLAQTRQRFSVCGIFFRLTVSCSHPGRTPPTRTLVSKRASVRPSSIS